MEGKSHSRELLDHKVSDLDHANLRVWLSYFRVYPNHLCKRLTFFAQVEMYISKIVVERSLQTDFGRLGLQTQYGIDVALLISPAHFPPFNPLPGVGAFIIAVVRSCFSASLWQGLGHGQQ
jgi:hypothetical protein